MPSRKRPNLLIFLPDATQAETVEPGHDCITPHLDRLAERGVRFTRAHTTCPICSPARASLMTGLLPHNHGVLDVEHARPPEQSDLRSDKPHWAHRLTEAGYRTGYFGKWHIERSGELDRFGWQQYWCKDRRYVSGLGRGTGGPDERQELDPELSANFPGPEGYNPILHFGVTDTPIEQRAVGTTMQHARRFLDESLGDGEPWCCCVSFSEPNEALIVGRDAYEQYDPDSLQLPASLHDDLADRPNLYRRAQRVTAGLDEHHWRRARACYYGRITEVDAQLGELIDRVEQAGELDNTIVIALSDHGRYVGAHGFEAHNFGAFEEAYRVPLIAAGPGVAAGRVSDALVSIADLCPTLLELAGAEPIEAPDARSFAAALADPEGASPRFDTGFAEYHGTRFPLMQRILWHGPWKFVFNGFDFDELYNLADDPHEMHNLAADPAHHERVQQMMKGIWRRIRETDDRTLLETHYYSMRFAVVGPNAAEDA